MSTRNIVPRSDNEGQLGTEQKKWAKYILMKYLLQTL